VRRFGQHTLGEEKKIDLVGILRGEKLFAQRIEIYCLNALALATQGHQWIILNAEKGDQDNLIKTALRSRDAIHTIHSGECKQLIGLVRNREPIPLLEAFLQIRPGAFTGYW
jgi:hypothetical protein